MAYDPTIRPSQAAAAELARRMDIRDREARLNPVAPSDEERDQVYDALFGQPKEVPLTEDQQAVWNAVLGIEHGRPARTYEEPHQADVRQTDIIQTNADNDTTATVADTERDALYNDLFGDEGATPPNGSLPAHPEV